MYKLSAPPPLSNSGEKSINILFVPSLTERIFVFDGISEDKPLFFSQAVGADTSCLIAKTKQDFSLEVSHFLLTERRFPLESVTNILTIFISCFSVC